MSRRRYSTAVHRCQFRLAFLLDPAHRLNEIICDNPTDLDIFDEVKALGLPEDWSLYEVALNGASGFVLVFDIEELPGQEDVDRVQRLLRDYRFPPGVRPRA